MTPSLRPVPFVLLAMLASGCGASAPNTPGADASVTDVPAVTDAPAAVDVPAVTDVPTVTDAPTATDVAMVTDVATVTCRPGSCGPHGHRHGAECHCNEGYVDRNMCCVPPPPCSAPDDTLEENDDPTSATAVPVEGGTWEALRACPADSDVFRIPLRAGQAVVIRATFTHADGDVDLFLFAPGTADLGHARPVARANGSANNERLAYTARVDGEFLLLVAGYNGAENTYGLSIEPAP